MATKAERFKSLAERSGPKRAPQSKRMRMTSARDKELNPGPGESARDRKTGETGQGTRNTAKKGHDAVYTLEPSDARPSRKSTRKSPGHVKTDSQLKRRQTRTATSPQTAAAKGATRVGAKKVAAHGAKTARTKSMRGTSMR